MRGAGADTFRAPLGSAAAGTTRGGRVATTDRPRLAAGGRTPRLAAGARLVGVTTTGGASWIGRRLRASGPRARRPPARPPPPPPPARTAARAPRRAPAPDHSRRRTALLSPFA